MGLPGGSSGGDIEWRRLGSFSFDAKERANLQSRELKSVTVNVRAGLVRVVLSRCHANQLNTHSQARKSPSSFPPPAQRAEPCPSSPFGQPELHPIHPKALITWLTERGLGATACMHACMCRGLKCWAICNVQAGIMGVSLSGSLEAPWPPPQPAPQPAPLLSQQPASPAGSSAASEAAAGAGGSTGARLDAKTAARVRELEEAKASAVAAEDYDEAKRLKHALDGLRALAAQLAELEARLAALSCATVALCCSAHVMTPMRNSPSWRPGQLRFGPVLHCACTAPMHTAVCTLSGGTMLRALAAQLAALEARSAALSMRRCRCATLCIPQHPCAPLSSPCLQKDADSMGHTVWRVHANMRS